MADITIKHTRAEGTLILGSAPDDGILELLNPWGFRYARTVGFIYLRGSRDRAADMRRIKGAQAALEGAKHTVTLSIDETVRRAFRDVEEERYLRAAERTVRLDERADRLQESSDAKWTEGRRIAASYQGEPVKVDHHSAGKHLRELGRARKLFGQSVTEQKEADRCRGLADAAATFEEGRKHVGTTRRRLDRLRADRGRIERQMEATVQTAVQVADTQQPIDPETLVDDLGRLDADHLDLCEQIREWEAHLEQAEADGAKVWRPEDFMPGDYVGLGERWYLVLRVNPKTLSVPKSVDFRARVYNRENQLGNKTSTLPYDKVTGRMSGEEMAAKLQAEDATA
ncbi:DUF3560 domain-containing protein [Streptomyces sp. NBC_01728]|uniref:DUF3560 domain-containing protein n=1 Tax=unclassified Streptomyces TaxID=2593676 RepID=UPI00224D81A9|nr:MULTISPECIES: DUF3560 domain-containing protein [unclassified Streptomyces]MCX4458548.1 DUF3560 domain-containing protein [Streptomyces sp. NBC_01719]MCX4497905.1 DUF3560 domain-containing protein [Streptomyces sp. NBC_01728]